MGRSIESMVRLSVFLIGLLVVLTFNAYACILPVPQTAPTDCSSGTDEPIRGTCDAFLELGPHSPSGSSHAAPPVHLEWIWSIDLLSDDPVPFQARQEPPPRAAPSLHCSIQSTVLRI